MFRDFRQTVARIGAEGAIRHLADSEEAGYGFTHNPRGVLLI